MRKVTRRRFLHAGTLGAASLVGLAFVGCDSGDGDDDENSGPTGEATQPASSGEPKVGGSISWGLSSDIISLEPHALIAGQYDTLWQIWDRLTEYSSDFEPSGRLAREWEINPDSTEFVLHIRDGVTWHSGREFTSEDVSFNISRVANPDIGLAQLGTMARWFESIETPDPRTVVLKTGGIPRPAIFDFFENLSIGDRESLEQPDATSAGGTGPFMFQEWRQGDRLTVVRNPNYWDTGKPYLAEQIFNVSMDPQTMVSQFEAGALQVLQDPPTRDLDRFRDAGNQVLIHQSTGGHFIIGWNTSLPMLSDKRVRQALSWAADRERFTSVILHDTVEPYSLPWPAGSPAYEEEKVHHFSFDLEKAKSLLSAAGVDSLDIEIIIPTNTTEMIEFAQILQSDYRQIGVNLEISPAEVAAFVSAVNADPPQFNGMWGASGARANLRPISMFNLSPTQYGTDGDNNTAYYSDEWKAVIDELNAEGDPEKHRALYSRVNDIMLEDCWLSYLAPRAPRIVIVQDLMDVTNYPVREGFEFRNAWLA